MSASTVVDQDASGAFAERMLGALNEASLVIMTSVGHRTGLFDALDANPDTTSMELAEAANLNERYVREWLAAMTTGRVVEFAPATGRYRLPPEHAVWLTRRASPDNLAVAAQFIPVTATVEDDIVHAFRNGGGVPYERYARFHEVMAEESAQTVGSVLFTHILPLVPGLEERLEQGIRVADLGCGRGASLLALARRFPQSSFTGYDFSADTVEYARARAADEGADNLTYEVRDLTTFDADATPESFDFITTFDAVHDQADPLALLTGIRRALAEDGIYLMQDIAGSSHVHENLEHPGGTFLYTVSCMHCMPVSLEQGGEGLGTLWGEQKARELLEAAGFESVEISQLEHDPFNAYYVVRP